MKKLIALLLVLTLALSFAACGSKEEAVEEEVLEETTEEMIDEIVDEDLSDINGVVELPGGGIELPEMDADGNFIMEENGETVIIGDNSMALEILTNIWAAYAEDEKFAVMGGNPESGIMDAPGLYDMAYAENLSYNLLIPADQLAGVEKAATMIHMMNANTFTSGVVSLASGVKMTDFAAAVRDAIHGNQWICGFPETLLIADMGRGNLLISFGVNDAMDPFQSNLTEAYGDAQILYKEAITG